jgi:hypothetical protein
VSRLKFAVFATGLLITAAPLDPAFALASSLAIGSNEIWASSTKDSQQEANAEALKECNKISPKKDCKLDFAKAVVRAEGPKRVGYGISAVSLADARKKALESCGEASCKVKSEITSPGFFALAASELDAEGNGSFHLAYQYTSITAAVKAAIAKCEENTGRKCSLSSASAIAGNYEIEADPAPKSSPVASAKNCRPNGPSLRCTSRCTNGNCLVTYDNGCKIRVQVQPQYDGFNNQWTYPAPAC